jgi:hypothetical protein
LTLAELGAADAKIESSSWFRRHRPTAAAARLGGEPLHPDLRIPGSPARPSSVTARCCSGRSRYEYRHMIAAAHTQSTLAAPRGNALHTALLTGAAVIVGGFLIAVVLAASVLMAGPLPATDGAAPVPQMLPQPSATSG